MPAEKSAPRAAPLLEALDDFRNSQGTVLRLAAFIEKRQAEIDNEREAMLARVRVEYPDVEDETILGIVRGMQSLAERYDLEGSGEEPSEEVLREVAHAIGSIIEELPPDYQTPKVLDDVTRAQAQEPSTPVLLESLLVNLVGGFELLVGATARHMVTEHPGALNASERVFTWQEIAGHGTLESLRESVIDRAVDDLLRESASGWMKFFASKFGVRTPELPDNHPFWEVLQRRHIIVHNGGRVSRAYLEQLPALKPQPELGEHLPVSGEYLRLAADILAVAALSLVGHAGRQLYKGEDLRYLNSHIANLPYRYLQDRRYEAARQLTVAFPPESFDTDYAGLVTKVNGWLALKRLGRFAECREEVETWQTSALSPIFRLARFALLDDFENALALGRRLRGTEELSTSFWITWPLLAELREYERGVINDETGDDSVP